MVVIWEYIVHLWSQEITMLLKIYWRRKDWAVIGNAKHIKTYVNQLGVSDDAPRLDFNIIIVIIIIIGLVYYKTVGALKSKQQINGKI